MAYRGHLRIWIATYVKPIAEDAACFKFRFLQSPPRGRSQYLCISERGAGQAMTTSPSCTTGTPRPSTAACHGLRPYPTSKTCPLGTARSSFGRFFQLGQGDPHPPRLRGAGAVWRLSRQNGVTSGRGRRRKRNLKHAKLISEDAAA